MISRCPVCGDPIDYCLGHGEIGDPEGFKILLQHDQGDHSQCDLECDGRANGDSELRAYRRQP